MSVGVKAYLYQDWKSEPVEIRRFSIDGDVAACYDYLAQKLCQVFPTLCADCVQIYWEDADGDRITISCDADVAEALERFDGTVFRVLVGGCEPRAAPPSEELDGLGEREGMTWQCSPLASKTPSQQRITCEGCRGQLCGVRYYKCQTCPEYVLCSACESRGDHDPHTMLRIDLSPRYSRELSDSDHTRYGACSEEWSTQGEVTRQKKPDESSLQQHQGFFSSIGETISSYLLEPLAGKISGYSSNSQEKWRQPREAQGGSSGDEEEEEKEKGGSRFPHLE
ncbi:hypothetical protein EMCRGX_G033231 [Ephydatia muelleri]